ncbi:unnamed protein product, partial [Ectocarpus fasciculatus]
QFRVNDRVEYRYRGRSKYYPGTVTEVHSNGTYTIICDDGDVEKFVVEDWVRPPAGRKPKGFDGSVGAKTTFQLGDKVEAKFKGSSLYFKARISNVNRDGTYSITYDDGDRDTAVSREDLRAVHGDTAMPPAHNHVRYQAGDKVETKSNFGMKYYKGRIVAENRDGTYAIEHDDGEKLPRVPSENIRALSGAVVHRSPSPNCADGSRRGSFASYNAGDKVEAKFKGGTKYYVGRISADNRDGTYNIDFDDGDKLRSVPPGDIRVLGGTVSHHSRSSDRRDSGHGHGGAARYRTGDQVEAKFMGGKNYFKGRISRENHDGTYGIGFDDGEKLRRVSPEDIRPIGGAVLSSRHSPDRGGDALNLGNATSYNVGDKVEAKFKGGTKYYVGRISADNRDGTYDIDFDDGDKLRSVPPGDIRVSELPPKYSQSLLLTMDSADTNAIAYDVGCAVEVCSNGDSTWSPATITKVCANGLYDIKRDGGAEEKGVICELLRLRVRRVNEPVVSSNPAAKASAPLEIVPIEDAAPTVETDEVLDVGIGSMVLARFYGFSDYNAGTIVNENDDGTFDIENAEDSVVYTSVMPDMIKPIRHTENLFIGAKVKYCVNKGNEEAATVVNIRTNGTFDVMLESGVTEIAVKYDMLEVVDKTDTRKTSKLQTQERVEHLKSALKLGSRIEARCRGGAAFYPGVVTKVRDQGTYDIDYDDGEQELSVSVNLIRLPEDSLIDGTSAPPVPQELSRKPTNSEQLVRPTINDRVKARFNAEGEWYNGFVHAENGDDTYVVHFDDGDRLSRVSVSDVTVIDDKRLNPLYVLRKSDKVEANFGNGGKYYPGVISEVQEDGTFNIDYDDGEIESGVDVALIRLPGAVQVLNPQLSSTDAGRGERAGQAPHDCLDTTEGASTKDLVEGSKVEARYRGKSKYYRGVISRVRLNGTFDVDYDDGEQESGVNSQLIRLTGSGQVPYDDLDMTEGASPEDLVVGSKVEARFRGKSRYYHGRISLVLSDGTFDVDYDDGEKETRVNRDCIRLVS